MVDLPFVDPFSDNILLRHLGKIRSRMEVLDDGLSVMPEMRQDWFALSRDARLRLILRLRDFHLPREVEFRLYETIDMMLREGLRYRSPDDPATFAEFSGERVRFARPRMPPTAAVVNGISGSGKSVSCFLSLGLFPQRITHPSFPQVEGEHIQVVWQSSEAPKSGRAEDLWRTLMADLDQITGHGRFVSHLASRSKAFRASAALQEWLTVAKGHFLGLLHIDEVQNLFRIPTLEKRRRRKPGETPPALTLVEDETLRWLLALMNSGIPLLLSGTPDGIEALSNRLSTLQRVTSMGAHLFTPFTGYDDKDFIRFVERLSRYQYTVGRMKVDEEFRKAFFRMTAGVPRMLITLWVGANRIALEDPTDTLETKHFATAEDKFLAPLRPAVAALAKPTPESLSAYDDLVTKHADLWLKVWSI